ncbi:MAG: hypothetical protein ACI84K_001790 [Pseudohongiellaceae bacterium]|jgi:hypothetical protein
MNVLQHPLLVLLLVTMMVAPPNATQASQKITYFPTTTESLSELDQSSYEYTPSKAGGYGEGFYLNAFDAQGNVVTALISMTNYNPFNKGMGSFDINWVENGKVRTVHQEFDQDEIKKDPIKGVQFGKHSYINVSADNTAIYYLGKDTNGAPIEIKINMTHTESGAQSGDSNLYLEGDKKSYWGLKMIAPRGQVVAQLKSDDTLSNLNLTGYLDHGNATAKVPDFSDHWYRLIFFSEKWTLALHEITPKFNFGPRKPQMLYISKENKAIGMFADWDYVDDGFKAHKDSPYDPPNSWELNLEHNDIKISGTVKVSKEVLAIDVLASVSWAVRMLVKAFYSNAWQHYFLVDVELTIEHDGVIEHVSGVGMATAEYY